MMLSTNTQTGIQRRRTQHRRQISTPAAYEVPSVRPLPANNMQTRRHTRNGMSLDIQNQDLEVIHSSHSSHDQPGPFLQEYSTVSNTNNLGQTPQHSMQVAQPHSQPQPGLQDAFVQSPVQTSFPSPRSPRRTLRGQSPQQPPLSPSKPPTEQQLKELHEHIQSVYGSCGQVFINILPTPVAAPQKPAQLASHEPLRLLTQPSLSVANDINLEPTSSAMTFNFDNPDLDMGYESSSYYTSDALSPSPVSSPQQKSMHSFLGSIEENEELAFSQPLSLFSEQNAVSSVGLPIDLEPFSQPAIFKDPEVDASLEYTGIAPEAVQQYISEQDPVTTKWTCMYRDCGKVFGRRENIRSHVQTHLGDRQFKCNGCGKCFVRQHDLKRHAKIHSGNKPYKCPCGAGFARQDALTRHRQRGMCVGGFADAVRKQAKRGRPKKNQPDMEQRLDKANRTRRAIASASSSVSGDSPCSDMRSPSPLEGYEPAHSQPLEQLLLDTQSFDDAITPSIENFGFEAPQDSFTDSVHVVDSSFATSSSNYPADTILLDIFQQLTKHSNTPPASPHDQRLDTTELVHGMNAAPVQRESTPSTSSVQSHPFSTPPTSPVEPKDDLEELFNSLPDNAYTQFDLEIKAMADFTSLDSSSYDLLNFEG